MVERRMKIAAQGVKEKIEVDFVVHNENNLGPRPIFMLSNMTPSVYYHCGPVYVKKPKPKPRSIPQ